ncbi:uridine kinase family protein [Anaerobium acetethylicum]|uniref:Uridine kinase n=1 Tax=Anaerobium acetethylicum TaxID=1619234 RepID=A0A1D3TPZ5_9FIRM|nr:nucleoside kinase [Anaerobium acetethylicum]SCP95553.1 uridine kinase [Anaerobium acetethylicum]
MRETHLRQGRQTVKLGLIKVIHDLFPEETLKTSYSIQEGVFCNLAGSVLSIREVKQIELRLNEWVKADSPIALLCKKDGYYQYQVGDVIVKAIYPAYTDTSLVEPFTIIPFSYGFIVDFGDIDKGATKPLVPPYKLSSAFEKNQIWLKNIGIQLVGDVNAYIREGNSLALLSIAEALHEKEIADIADIILQQRRALRILLIAGPSSSGKTSFAQRLSTQLQVNGLKPVLLSLDNYFVNREDTPIDAEGNYDFDCLEALDLPYLQDQLLRLIDGETVETPIFDFVTGTRKKETKTLNVGPSEILLMEGIHALNPKLVSNINRSYIYKIYVSALGGLNIDLMSRLPTTEMRLIRRIVRDERCRGAAPEKTMVQWPGVRRGEYKNIFTFQEEADVMFNSSLLYEMNALRPFAEAALKQIGDDSSYLEARDRLLNLLTFFEPMEITKVPFNSILREFVGGSMYFNEK